MSLKGGQSLEDKLYAFKYFISGQGISFVVLKATTSELVGPKRKHLNYLISMTNETNVSIPNLTKYLMQRAKHCEWSVSFKSLITIHYLMSYGNERFIQNLASSTVNNRSFGRLASFMDRTSTLAYDMSTFLRRYSIYISAKINTYRSLGLDFCRLITNSSKGEQSILRDMSLDQLVTTLPILQEQFDNLIAFDASPSDLNNGIINSAFSFLFKDFIKLYIAYQTSILRLLELYFTVTHLKRAQELYEAYRKFLVRMDKVSDFMRVIDSVGMDKSDLPNLSKAPNLSFQLLKKHLNQLEPSRINNSKHTTSDTTKWQPIESAVSIRLESTRRRSSLLTRGVLTKTAVPGQSVEVPRLKSPEIGKKQRQRTITTIADTSGSAQPASPWGRTSPSRAEEIGSASAATTQIHCDMMEETIPTEADANKANAMHPMQAIEPNTASKFGVMDLVLDTNEQEPDLMQMNDEDCSSSQSRPTCSVSGSLPPSDWVQV